MSLVRKLMVPVFVLVLSIGAHAQIKNPQTITVKILGNCGMCKATIEKAGSIKKVASVDWDKDTRMASITYDAKQTNPDQVLKRIALAGYDNEQYLAPDDVYSKLPGCCQYEREDKVAIENAKNHPSEGHNSHDSAAMGHSTHKVNKDEVGQKDGLAEVFNAYFTLEQALVNSDVKMAAAGASTLSQAIGSVDMASPNSDAHTEWMKVKKKLADSAKGIATAKEIKRQRALFAQLSQDMYALARAADPAGTIYYNHCPMFNDGEGANWLSREKGIKNPYYGSQMLSCGKTVETLD